MGTVPNQQSSVAERISPATQRKILELAAEYECAGAEMTRAFMRDKHIQGAKEAYAIAYMDLYCAVMALTNGTLDAEPSSCERG